MAFEHIYRAKAKKVPKEIRKVILQEDWISKAINVHEKDTPMEFLFDTYMEYIDVTGEHDDFTCHQCRQAVLNDWKDLEPYLKELDA